MYPDYNRKPGGQTLVCSLVRILFLPINLLAKPRASLLFIPWSLGPPVKGIRQEGKELFRNISHLVQDSNRLHVTGPRGSWPARYPTLTHTVKTRGSAIAGKTPGAINKLRDRLSTATVTLCSVNRRQRHVAVID